MKLVAAVLLVLLSGCSGSEDSGRSVSTSHQATVDFAALGEEGVGFGLHPTEDPVIVSTTTVSGTLLVCPAAPDLSALAESTGCLPLLAGQPTELEPTTGSEHIGIRVTSAKPGSTGGAVTLNWNGADSFFAFQPGVVAPSASKSIILTVMAPGEFGAGLRPDSPWELGVVGPGTTSSHSGPGSEAASFERFIVTERAEAGEWTVTYTNRSDDPQTPTISIEWPVPHSA